MRTLLWRHRRKLTWVILPVALGAIALQFTGHKDSALMLAAVSAALLAASAVVDWRCKPPPPALSEDEKARIRGVRDSADELTAIRTLRTTHPDLGLLEAAVLVREL